MKVEVDNPTTKDLAIRVQCPLPASHPRQQVALESVTPPVSGYSRDSWGNPLMEFRPGSPAPGTKTTLSLALWVRSRQQVVDVDARAIPPAGALPPEAKEGLASSKQFPSQDPVLRAEVQRLLENEPNPWYRALRLYDFTRSLHFQLTRRPRDVREVLRTRLAQCSDAAALFVTLCRTAGIPAQYVAGLYLTEGAESLDEMHAWAEFWLPGAGWVPADPTQARFDDSLRLSRFASTVPEYIRLWGGTPSAAGVTVNPPASPGRAPRLSLHFGIQPVPQESGGRSLVERFPVPPLPATLPSPMPTTAPAESQEALRQMARGHRSEAATLAEHAVTADPASWEAWRAWLETTTGEMDLSALAQRMQGPVRRAPAWIGKSVEGQLLVRAQQWSNAERSLVAAVSLHDSTETHENLGRFFLQTRQVSKALGEYSRALGCDPRNLHVHRDLVSLYVALEAWDGVAQVCAQAQVALPAVVDFPLSAGQALHRLGQHEKAREAFQAALQLTPGDGWLHAMLGWTLKELHDPTGALREIEQGLKLGIASPEKAFFEGMARDLRTQR